MYLSKIKDEEGITYIYEFPYYTSKKNIVNWIMSIIQLNNIKYNEIRLCNFFYDLESKDDSIILRFPFTESDLLAELSNRCLDYVIFETFYDNEPIVIYLSLDQYHIFIATHNKDFKDYNALENLFVNKRTRI